MVFRYLYKFTFDMLIDGTILIFDDPNVTDSAAVTNSWSFDIDEQKIFLWKTITSLETTANRYQQSEQQQGTISMDMMTDVIDAATALILALAPAINLHQNARQSYGIETSNEDANSVIDPIFRFYCNSRQTMRYSPLLQSLTTTVAPILAVIAASSSSNAAVIEWIQFVEEHAANIDSMNG